MQRFYVQLTNLWSSLLSRLYVSNVLLTALSAYYAQQGFCNCRASVHPSVCLSHPAAAAGLVLWARWTADINRLLHGRRSAAAAPQHCAQQQMQGVPRFS